MSGYSNTGRAALGRPMAPVPGSTDAMGTDLACRQSASAHAPRLSRREGRLATCTSDDKGSDKKPPKDKPAPPKPKPDEKPEDELPDPPRGQAPKLPFID